MALETPVGWSSWFGNRSWVREYCSGRVRSVTSEKGTNELNECSPVGFGVNHREEIRNFWHKSTLSPERTQVTERYVRVEMGL